LMISSTLTAVTPWVIVSLAQRKSDSVGRLDYRYSL